MDIKTKYSINDIVYPINKEHKKKWVICELCDGKGLILVKDKTRQCPDCYGRTGKTEYEPQKWLCGKTGTIGQVGYIIRNIESVGFASNIGHYKEGCNTIKEEYMLYETGVGSGQIWPVDRLYPTLEEAQIECDKKNKEENKG